MPTNHVIKQNARAALRNKWPNALAIGGIMMAVLFVHLIVYQFGFMLFSYLTTDMTAALLAAIPTILVLQFFGMPALYGILRWFWFTSQEESVPISEIFCYFSSGREYLRSTSLSFRIFLRIAAILILCYLPSLLILAVRQPFTYKLFHTAMPYWVSGLWMLGQVLTVFGTILAVILLMRYFAAPILMINDASISPERALNLSVIISKSANGRTILMLLSFIGWYLLSLLIVPMLYTVPLFTCSYAVYCRFLIENYNQKAARHNAEMTGAHYQPNSYHASFFG